jgi:hypothetical protein
MIRALEVAFSVLMLSAYCGCSGGGSSWREVKAFADDYALNDLWVFGPDDVWAVGQAIHRFDGTDWTLQPSENHAGFTAIWGFSPEDVWIAGGDTLLHWDGSSLARTDLGAQGMQSATAIWGLAPDRLWIAGDSATVLHWNGSSWARRNTPCSSNTSIFGFSENDLWTQGTFGTCHYDGSDWTEVELEIWGGGGDVFGFSTDDVWVVAESAEAAHWDGAQWTIFENGGFVGELSSLWGPRSDDLWGVGTAGAIAHFDGRRWTQVTHQVIGSPFLRMFHAVHGSSAEEVWAVGTELGANRNCSLVFRYQAD